MQVDIRNVTQVFGCHQALHNITLHIETGDTVLLVGANGAGKSTLLRLLAGLIHPTSGQIYADGRSIGSSSYREHIGYLPQRPRFYAQQTPSEWLHYLAQLKAIPYQLCHRRVDELLHVHQLTTCAHLPIGSLSLGVRQRLALATAYLNDPEVALLDEPLTNLDPDIRLVTLDWLATTLPGRITVVATHTLAGFEYLASRLVMLRGGTLMHDIPTDVALHRVSGRVWQVIQPHGTQPPACEAILGSKYSATCSEWRILCNGTPPGGTPAQPMLEDAYIALQISGNS